MDSSNRISSTNASFPEYLDFQKLREKGIAYCQRLASDLWTDFNLHDPGLTILEVLCYALTDLGYRTNLPIAELVARSPEQKQKDHKLAGSDGKPFDDNFFTAEQILTCNPVTLLDLRRLLIDVPGVRNAWVELADTAETDIYLNNRESKLDYESPEILQDEGDTTSAAAKLTLDGLYRVYLELDDEPDPDPCGDAVVPLERILDDVKTLLHRHRNLCEDFLDVTILNDEQIRLCIDIEIDASADAADVLLDMYKALTELLSPTIRFYNLQEMLARGKGIEEIYEGRPLAPLAKVVEDCRLGACSHGFIDKEELENTERRTELHASDLYRTIMQLTGVSAVRKLSMANVINGIARTQGEKWCLRLTPGHRQVFDLKGSKITFYKEPLFFDVDPKLVDDVQKRFDEERAARAKAPLAKEHLDSPPPEGTYRHDLGDYRSIMHEFPLAYKIGAGKIEKGLSPKRRAQIHQLRAYLLVYDQILANYLAQLANLRELFSMRPDQSRGQKTRTYFTKPLGRVGDADDVGDVGDVPDFQTLVQDYAQDRYAPGAPPISQRYQNYLDDIAERPETYAERRNLFLDHLLARFAESFTDYVLLMFGVEGQRLDSERIIRDKTNFLVNYPETSRDRGKGFDYSGPARWDTDNVSGLDKRVSRLLGFGGPECESEAVKKLIGERHLHGRLCHVDVVKSDGTWHWSIEVPGIDGDDVLVLRSHFGYADEAKTERALDLFRRSALEPRRYRRLTHSRYTRFGFGVLEPSDEGRDLKEPSILATFPRLFPPSGNGTKIDSERNAAIHKVATFFAKHGESFTADDFDTVAEGESFFFAVTVDISEFGVTEFLSCTGYASREDARQAARVFITQAAKPSEYKKYSRDGFVHHGFAVVDAEGTLLTKVAQPWQTTETRDHYLVQLLQMVHRGAVRCEVFEETNDPNGSYCVDVKGPNEEVLLSGVQVSGNPEQAEEARIALERLARRREGLRRTADGGRVGLYGIQLVDETDRIIARNPYFYATPGSRNEAFRRIDKLLRENRYRVGTEGNTRGYRFLLVGDIQSHKLISRCSYPDKAHAYSACAQLSFRLRDRNAYKLGHRLVLRDPDGIVEAVSEPGEPEELAAMRDALIAEAENAPSWSSRIQQATSTYRCRLTGAAERVLLETERENQAWQDCEQIVKLAQQDSHFRYVTASDASLYGFELVSTDGRTQAVHPTFYATEEERDMQILAVKCLAGTEGLHLVEHLLLRPKNPDSSNGRKSDAFLPIARECSDASADLTPFDADPYSFRATVVVPYWPHRFSEIKFRRFFERTLRTEAPAHVFLKICWVSPRQMRAFEDAYGQWRQALAHPGCDQTPAHNALVEVLLALRSVYAEGRLSGEGKDKDNAPMILDQTKLGSAGVLP